MKGGKILFLPDEDGSNACLKVLWILLVIHVQFTRHEEEEGDGTDTISFSVLHTSNLYGQVQEMQWGPRHFGGMPRIIHLLKAANQSKTPMLFFDTGDSLTGTLWYTMFGIDIMILFYKMALPTAINFGELDMYVGIANLTKFITEVGSPMLCCNCDFSKEPKLQELIVPSVKVTVDGTEIGIMGYITDQAKSLSKMFENITVTDEVASIAAEVMRLKEEGISIIILLGHGSRQEDHDILSKVNGINLLVGGHSRTLAYNGQIPQSINFLEKNCEYPLMIRNPSGIEIPAVYAFIRGYVVGNISMTFNKKGKLLNYIGNAIVMDDDKSSDADAVKEIETREGQVKEYMQKSVGKSRVDFDGDQCRVKECNAGNLLADAFVDYEARHSQSKYWTEAPLAIVNGGAFTEAVEFQGSDNEFTMRTVNQISPFDNHLYVVEMNGSTFRKAVHYSVSESKIGDEKFLQYSGVHVILNFGKQEGERVIMIKVRCGACETPMYDHLQDDARYKVIMSDYLFYGGDGYSMFRQERISSRTVGKMSFEVLSAYVEHYQTIQTGHEERVLILVPKEHSRRRIRSDGRLYTLDKCRILLVITFTVTVSNIHTF